MLGIAIKRDRRSSRNAQMGWKREIRRKDWAKRDWAIAKNHVDCFNGHGDILPCFLSSFQVEVHNVNSQF